MAKLRKPSRDVKAEKKAGTVKSGVAVDKKKNKVKRKESFSLYIHKVLKKGNKILELQPKPWVSRTLSLATFSSA